MRIMILLQQQGQVAEPEPSATIKLRSWWYTQWCKCRQSMDGLMAWHLDASMYMHGGGAGGGCTSWTSGASCHGQLLASRQRLQPCSAIPKAWHWAWKFDGGVEGLTAAAVQSATAGERCQGVTQHPVPRLLVRQLHQHGGAVAGGQVGQRQRRLVVGQPGARQRHGTCSAVHDGHHVRRVGHRQQHALGHLQGADHLQPPPASATSGHGQQRLV